MTSRSRLLMLAGEVHELQDGLVSIFDPTFVIRSGLARLGSRWPRIELGWETSDISGS
jgi:hypothetical protein